MAKKLLEQLSDALRIRHYSYRTEQAYVDWVRRYILFHQNRLHLNEANLQRAIKQAAKLARNFSVTRMSRQP